jgi:hypothetical protein
VPVLEHLGVNGWGPPKSLSDNCARPNGTFDESLLRIAVSEKVLLNSEEHLIESPKHAGILAGCNENATFYCVIPKDQAALCVTVA